MIFRMMMQLLTGLAVALVSASPGATQVVSGQRDSVFAVWPGEIFEYGVLSLASALDTLHPMVKVYAKPGDTLPVDSLPAGTMVKYSRLSEIDRIGGKLLPDGEWFRLELAGRGAWVPDQNLMTFAGLDWTGDSQLYCRRLGPRIVVLYSSGQFWESYSSAFSLWVHDRGRGVWTLEDLVLNAIECGLYMRPVIDSISQGGTLIHLSSIGIDGDEMWGEKAIYHIQGLRLAAERRETVREHRTDE